MPIQNLDEFTALEPLFRIIGEALDGAAVDAGQALPVAAAAVGLRGFLEVGPGAFGLVGARVVGAGIPIGLRLQDHVIDVLGGRDRV